MTLYDFLSGMLVAAFLVAALFFLRFWRRTGDPLFRSFAAAFLLLGVGQTLLALCGLPIEERSWIYLIRLTAFLLILAAVFRKNRSAVG
ncbi:DUF5985 family protein [Sphingomonas sp. BN140010]|uniref:DUF5985 family protein n=1 Tax=Sphingomonas arvum TaxID=2992113 RepID=A0ABT3JFS2_9SPHN|nr:DUF5985 family protein [Sphingomonas sp. BN140010]MCW3797925.1 DUF5985 family protein [Sphingomonas sp. BN140010]